MNRHDLHQSPAAPARARDARAVDAAPDRRPGVPMELEPPRHAGHAHWDEPERMAEPSVRVLRRVDLEELTPVFSTATPPRGVSGLMRRLAYRTPEHHTSHWLILLVADRVDAIEHDPKTLLSLSTLVAGGVGLAAYALSVRRRPSFSWTRWMR